MNRFTIKDWVCLLDEAALEARRQANRDAAQSQGGLPGPLRGNYWRQIEVVATAEQVRLELGNVDAEAAAGGYWRGSEACRSHTFTWEDLRDTQFIDTLLAREQVVVYRRIVDILAKLESRTVALREALGAF